MCDGARLIKMARKAIYKSHRFFDRMIIMYTQMQRTGLYNLICTFNFQRVHMEARLWLLQFHV
ncbi:MAG TPA: hypothetical protein DEP42_04860 [Ruminococcaceae bacterium]|nr:hypothetical protein [Oscillospiraceae bacterium]